MSSSGAVSHLEPRALWQHFARLNSVPRPSGHEGRASTLLKEFGLGLGLETSQYPAGNVLIRKPATPGMEDRVTVVLQGHLDMVQ